MILSASSLCCTNGLLMDKVAKKLLKILHFFKIKGHFNYANIENESKTPTIYIEHRNTGISNTWGIYIPCLYYSVNKQ